MSTEVTELIDALKRGSISLSEVAQRFRERAWPSTRGPKPETCLDRATAAAADPDPLVPGSFDEVAAAYHRGDISIDDYRTLAEAAAESTRGGQKRHG
ncbi:MAG: hypothetical protein ACRD22_17950 [Terriglobia bacterium]